MPWFRVDDTLHGHPKIRRAGLPAMGLWAVAGSYCMAYKTDGAVPGWFIESWPQGGRRARELVENDLWIVTETGYQFHDWDDFQPTAEEIEKDRESARERQRRRRERLRETRDSHEGVTPEVTRDVTRESQDPPPSRPVPTKKSESDGDLFDEFWTRYPRKEGKGAARKAWAKAVKLIDPTELINITRSYGVRMAGAEKRFIPHPATWLNQERWSDEVDDQKAEAADEWFQPFTLPECPPEIADDPERYAAWVDDQRDAWRQEGGR